MSVESDDALIYINEKGEKIRIESLEDYSNLWAKYEKLLAKYNGAFEWAADLFFEGAITAEKIKKEYEESLK